VKHYLALLQELEVEANATKTHTHLQTYEFAKRWFRNGIEVTGLSPHALLSTNRQYTLLAEELMGLEKR